MKRIYEFITKANQVLLFLLIVGVAAWVGYNLYREFMRPAYSPPQVAIVQTPEAAKNITVTDVRWLGTISGVNFFGILKKEVSATANNDDDTHVSLESAASKISGTKGYYNEEQIVNVVMSGIAAKPKNLLQSDGFVLEWNLATNRYSGEQVKASVFTCVVEDTNGNKLLDVKDRQDLYIVPTDASKGVIVIKGINQYQWMSASRILIKSIKDGRIHFNQLDVDTLENLELSWN